MLDIKIIIWVILSIMFFSLSIYGYRAIKPLEKYINKMNETRGVITVQIGPTDFHELNTKLFNTIKTVSNMGFLAGIISAFAAFLSIWI